MKSGIGGICRVKHFAHHFGELKRFRLVARLKRGTKNVFGSHPDIAADRTSWCYFPDLFFFRRKNMKVHNLSPRKHLSFCGFATFLLFLVFSPVFAATLRVPTTTYPTIQSAIDAADWFDTVLVADGTYKGGANKDLDFEGKTITVKSENGPANCIIDCEGVGRGFYFHSDEGPESQVSGFTIRNGYADNGGGIYIGSYYNSSPTISNCIVINNEATYQYGGGGGIYVGDDCYPKITSCTVTNNIAQHYGGGIYSEGYGDFMDCAINGNYAEDRGGGVYCDASSANFNGCTIQDNSTGDAESDGGGIFVNSGSNIFINCIVTGNSAYDDGGGFYLYSSSPTITNCTVSDNSVEDKGGGIYFYGSSPKIWNTIFWGDTPNEYYISSGTPQFHNCDVPGGHIDQDPLFMGDGNYRLTSASPVINKGSNDATRLPQQDKDGHWRILNTTVDIGAYEYSGNLQAPSISTGAASSVMERTATLNGTVNPNGFRTQYHFQFGTTTGYGMVTPVADAGMSTTVTSVENIRSRLQPATTYHYRLTATNGFQTVYGSERTFTTEPLPPTIITRAATAVNSTQPTLNGTVNPNGETTTYFFEYGTTTAYGNTSETKSADAGDNDLAIFVGITDLTQNTVYHYRVVAQNNSGKSYGADETFTTSIYAGNTLRVPMAYLTIQDAINAAVDGDTVLVADGTYKGEKNKDLGFEGKSITVKSENGPANCIIDCEGEGRGFCFDSDEEPEAEVSGFTIKNGYASDGGGIYIGGYFDSSPTVSNCIVTGNKATFSYGGGGGIYVGDDCYPKITNCIITDNIAYHYGGGIYSEDGYGDFMDCTISGNYAEDRGGGVYCDYSGATFNRCIIQNNRTGKAESDGGGVFVNSGSNIFSNCIVTGNSTWDDGGGFYLYSSSTTITNCTVSGNSVESNGGGVFFYDSSPKIWNCIFWGDTPNEFYVYSGTPEIHYSDIEGGYSGTGSIDSDPLFVGNGDYHLTSNQLPSPCINAGVDYAPELPSTDKDGNARIIDGRPDMGAYEYEKLSPIAITGAVSGVTGTSAILQGVVYPQGANTQYYFQYGTTEAYGQTSPYTDAGAGKSGKSVDYSITGLGTATEYHYRVAARNINFTAYGSDQTFTTDVSYVYVNKNDETCGGKTPCYTAIQTAIDAAGSGSVVKIAAGTYTETFILNQSKSLTLTGGWDSSYTGQTPGSTIIKAPKATQGSLTLQNVFIKP